MASPTGPTRTSNLGIAPNLGALLCYLPVCCLGFIFAVVVAIVEKQSRFLRFHAFQSILLHGAVIVVGLVLWFIQFVFAMVDIGIMGILLFPLQLLVGLGFLGLAIFLMIKAYNNEEYELPRIGQMARSWV